MAVLLYFTAGRVQQSPPLIQSVDSAGDSGGESRVLEPVADGRDIVMITLHKSENTSLGFSVVGLKSENKGELGIFVQEIQPDGIAAR